MNPRLDLQRATSVFLALSLAAATAIDAQVVGPERSEFPSTALPTRATGETTPGVFQAQARLPQIPLQWGPVALHPHFVYRLMNGDGIPARPGREFKTTTHDISPGVLVAVGEKWSFDYTPTWTYYSNDAFKDTVDHAVRLNGGTSYGDWDFGLAFSYTYDSPALLETGGQTTQERFSTNANVSYHLSSRTVLELTAVGSARYGSQFNDSRDWRTRNWLNYQVNPRVTVGVSAGLGYVEVETGSDMSYVEAGGRIGWRPTEKLTFHVDAGMENRRFRVGGLNDRSTPKYGATLSYTPVETTSFSLTANQTVSPSYFRDQITTGRSYGLGLQQRFLKRFHLSLHYTHATSAYDSTASDVTGVRDDTSKSFTARLSTALFQRGSVALVFRDTTNRSNLEDYDVTSTQYGFEIGLRF